MLLRSALRVRLPPLLGSSTKLPIKPAFLHCQATPSSSSSEAAPSKPNIKELASCARVRVADEEISDYEPKINSILDWFGELQQVDISSVPPAMHGTQQSTTLRADEPVMYANREDLLAMAPASEKQMFRVPRTATGADEEPAAAPSSSSSSSSGGDPQPSSSSSSSSSGRSSAGPSDAGPSEAAQLEALQVMDFRVGKIVSCEKHPEADSLYVEQIDVGEPEPRTIVSGLVKYVPIEQMKDRMVVVLANLKPRNMRKIKSFGMVMAASNEEHTMVEPIAPPAGAAPGERIFFADTEQQPAAVPNAVEKKKLWEIAAPGMRTDAQGVAGWKGKAMQTSAGPVTAPSLADARIA
ncbi:hypothetical protein DUNSADRAFT_15409 [Dunaliella salina]|uniref:Glutamyl-tRNA(Gln) amidotransferase subunit C, chloroplastic/mitochondrial n=1 Tax=Dunaliella salina TaxID=3046 RepID=A0ABQ7G5L8_DUNSA|nr:hypothetical protein DUNSADRAFT_15409 [Dunaliella salina]|eukprot:KAF5829872.1 hypothetical protein DUNSADRAFT_15409 [Dunaliella salina]